MAYRQNIEKISQKPFERLLTPMSVSKWCTSSIRLGENMRWMRWNQMECPKFLCHTKGCKKPIGGKKTTICNLFTFHQYTKNKSYWKDLIVKLRKFWLASNNIKLILSHKLFSYMKQGSFKPHYWTFDLSGPSLKGSMWWISLVLTY